MTVIVLNRMWIEDLQNDQGQSGEIPGLTFLWVYLVLNAAILSRAFCAHEDCGYRSTI